MPEQGPFLGQHGRCATHSQPTGARTDKRSWCQISGMGARTQSVLPALSRSSRSQGPYEGHTNILRCPPDTFLGHIPSTDRAKGARHAISVLNSWHLLSIFSYSSQLSAHGYCLPLAPRVCSAD